MNEGACPDVACFPVHKEKGKTEQSAAENLGYSLTKQERCGDVCKCNMTPTEKKCYCNGAQDKYVLEVPELVNNCVVDDCSESNLFENAYEKHLEE